MSGTGAGMPAQTGSRRLMWDALPPAVRKQFELLVGQRVVAAVSQPGGFSEGLAVRARLSDGSGVFVKAAHVLTAPAEASHHRQEIAISQRLPIDAPVPRLLHVHDDGEWVALVFEEIPGNLPAQPWQRDDLDRVLAAISDLVNALTPAPIDASLPALPRLGGWADLTQPVVRERLRALSGWAADHLDDLVALESGADVAGSTLLHGDLYPFNLLLTPDRVVVIDWPHAWIGAPFCDLVTLLSSARLSGVDPQPIVESHPLTRGAGREQIDGLLALHSGFLLRGAVSAGPDADPNIVAMMTALGLASVHWLADRWPTTK
ncbi:phosphotransferase [Nonomuraea sp. NPDC046802]|uniref:phosphotransferase family protein n=1 Tax=Nonomuraea sp. NPDC046802 TaxID=3154919 RepID=UPI00340B5BD0